MKTGGVDTKNLGTLQVGDTQVIDLRDVDLADIDVSGLDAGQEPRRTAPPPLPAQLPGSAPETSALAPPPAVGLSSPAPSRQRSTGFYLGVLAVCLGLSLAVGFVIASSLRRGAAAAPAPSSAALSEPSSAPPAASPSAAAPEAPSAAPGPRVITISPVEVQ
jgi:hypothetical protein